VGETAEDGVAIRGREGSWKKLERGSFKVSKFRSQLFFELINGHTPLCPYRLKPFRAVSPTRFYCPEKIY
jgi:hypothetical protein